MAVFNIINNSNSNTLISGTTYDDGIQNSSGGSNVTIEAGAGNDSIENWGNNSSINGQEGNDSITNAHSALNVTLNGGDGDDYFQDIGKRTVILGGKGNDTIDLYIGLHASSANAKIVYYEGDGNDIIYNFTSGDTLSISSESYSTTQSGNNIIFTVGDGNITLFGENYINPFDFDIHVDFNKISWRLSGTTATYGTSSNTEITINGIKSLDGINLSGNTVTVANSALNSSNVTISDGYYLALGATCSMLKRRCA